MIVPLTSEQWRQLRVLVRAGGAPVPGIKLRVVMSRKSKFGEFLNELVALGLVERAGEIETKSPEEAAKLSRVPEPFRHTYRLTEAGAHAAEYGTYRREPRSS